MLIVIGRDGRVLWNDGGARLSHRIDELATTLCDVLDRGTTIPSLAGSPPGD
jgi:hypothetical protein